MKLHQFQAQLAGRPKPELPYYVVGNVARFQLAEFEEGKHSRSQLPGLMEEALGQKLDVYLYNGPEVEVAGVKAWGKKPWRKKVGAKYEYFSKLSEILR